MHAANMLGEVVRWLNATHPAIWNRRGGRDHIWLMTHDEGALILFVCLLECLLFFVLFNSLRPDSLLAHRLPEVPRGDCA